MTPAKAITPAVSRRKSKRAAECLITARVAGPCAHCGVPQRELHITEANELYCGGHCPTCNDGGKRNQ
jgi:hypothetical protein